MIVDNQKLSPHQRLQPRIEMDYQNVNQLFNSQRLKSQNKTFVTFPSRQNLSMTYEQFFDAYCQISKFLNLRTLNQGDRIIIIFSNSPEFLLFYFGALRLGITVIPLNPSLSPSEIDYIIKDSESKAIFHEVSIEDKIQKLDKKILGDKLVEMFPEIPPFQGNTDFRHRFVFKYPKVDNLPTKMEHHEEFTSNIGIYDEAVIIYTSGTTGNPKGVVLSHLNLLADAKAISEWFMFDSDTRALCTLPLFHNNGQITTLLAPLYQNGSTFIVDSKSSLIAFWGLIQKYGITWTSVMPSILSVLLSLPSGRKDDTLNGILCGGQILTRSVQDNFETKFKVAIFEGYGLTETTSFSCISDFPATKRKFGTIGKPLPINQMSIVDNQGNHLGPDEEGEICVRGYNVTNEYLGLSEKNKESFEYGWFHSGDYGFKDKEGYFYFNGRKDSLIIKGGENIYPAELENVLYKNPKVEECAVIGIPDRLLGENICAFVKCKSDNTSEKELMAYCSDKIAPFKQAKRIIVINQIGGFNEIPKGPTKKVLYRKLRDYYKNNIQKSD